MVDMANPRYGGFWMRLLAAILDSFIIGIPAIIIQLAIIFITGMQSLQYVISLALVVLVVYLEGMKGGTPGKLILGMRIVNQNGDYIGIPSAILRYIGKFVSALIIGIGFLMIAWDSKKQGLHDKIAKTYVVRK